MDKAAPRGTAARTGVLLRWPILALLGHVALSGPALAEDAGASDSGASGSGQGGGGVQGGGVQGGGLGGGLGGAGLGGNGPLIASPSVLPATGIGAAGPDVRVGNLGAQMDGQMNGQMNQGSAGGSAGRLLEPNERAWTLTPSIGLTEEYTTGGQNGGQNGGQGTGRGGQFITTLQPAIVVSGDTTRLHGDLSYTPQIEFYSPDGNQNQVAQNFNARLLATLLPQTLFLDLRGAGAVQSIIAGQAPNDINTLARGNTTQTYSFSASPYAVHRFGPWGTGEIGGSVARTIQSALQPAGQGPGNPSLTDLADASNQNVTSTSGHLAFATGEAFSRYSGTALGQLTSFDGAGVLRGAYRDTATLDNGYALTRTITALALIGWERLHYAGSSPVDIDDAIWGVGLRLEPNADSEITIRYNHRDGFNSASVDASYQPTARTRIYARYSSGLATQAEQLQNALATSDLDTLGNPVDHTTGAPLVGVGDFFGTQNSLYKTTIASLTGVLSLDRDTVSASVNSQTQTLLSASNAIGLARGSTSGVYGALTWSHTLRANLISTLYAQYGTQSSGDSATAGFAGTGQGGTAGFGSGDQQLVAISASLSYALTPTLSGQLQYSYNQTFGGDQSASNQVGGGNLQGNTGQSIVLVSLIKSF